MICFSTALIQSSLSEMQIGLQPGFESSFLSFHLYAKKVTMMDKMKSCIISVYSNIKSSFTLKTLLGRYTLRVALIYSSLSYYTIIVHFVILICSSIQ